jgi:uncharacterized protein YfdQ (DUF2303 family)
VPDNISLTEIADLVADTRVLPGGAVVLRDEHTLVSLERIRDEPNRSRGTIQASSADSFARIAMELVGEYPKRVYNIVDNGSMCAIMNDDGSAAPAWRDWRVIYTPKRDEAWTRWLATFGTQDAPKWVTQLAFAEFVEDRLADFQTPSGIEMLEIAQKFDVARNGSFKSAVRLDNGSTQFAVESNVSTLITVPSVISIGIPVYEGQSRYKVSARFRYRINDDKLAITVRINDQVDLVRTAAADLLDDAKRLMPGYQFYQVGEFPHSVQAL